MFAFVGACEIVVKDFNRCTAIFIFCHYQVCALYYLCLFYLHFFLRFLLIFLLFFCLLLNFFNLLKVVVVVISSSGSVGIIVISIDSINLNVNTSLSYLLIDIEEVDVIIYLPPAILLFYV